MSHFAGHLSFLFFIVLLASTYIEAREGKVFINTVDINSKNENSNVKGSSFHLLESPTPSPAPVISEISHAPAPFESEIAPAPIENGFAPAPVEVDNAYGLYGRGFRDQFLPKKTAVPSRSATSNKVDVNDEDDIPTDEFETESFREFNAGKSQNSYGNNYNNKGYYTSNNNENGHLPSNFDKEWYTNGNSGNGYVERQGMSDTRFLENGKYYHDIENENYNQNRYESVRKSGKNEGYYGEKSKYEFDNGNGYVERQGMSDTKFLENGKYYHDIENEIYNQNGYKSVRKSGNNDGYYGEKSKYEFDSMDEYERQQGYPDTQREYVP